MPGDSQARRSVGMRRTWTWTGLDQKGLDLLAGFVEACEEIHEYGVASGSASLSTLRSLLPSEADLSVQGNTFKEQFPLPGFLEACAEIHPEDSVTFGSDSLSALRSLLPSASDLSVSLPFFFSPRPAG